MKRQLLLSAAAALVTVGASITIVHTQAARACEVWSRAENRCLDAPPPTPVSPAGHTDPNRQAALAALRAVQSVLAGGANTAEFKTYYLQARVKVDALPASPENAGIKEVNAIYADVVTLSIAVQVQAIEPQEVKDLQLRYADNPDFSVRDVLYRLPEWGFGRASDRFSQDLALKLLREGIQTLLHLAEVKLASVS